MRTLSASFVVPTLETIVNNVVNLVGAQAAVDTADSGVFGQHIAYACQNNQDADNVAAYFKKFEALYKIETGEKSMPNVYRSSKSVISNAIDLGIDLLNEDNLPRGKTELQKLIKDAKTPKSADSKFTDACAQMIGWLESGEMTMSKADASALLAQVITTMQAALK